MLNIRLGIATVILLLGALAALPLCVVLYLSYGWQVTQLRDEARWVQERDARAAARDITWRLEATAAHVRFVEQLSRLNGGALTLPEAEVRELSFPGALGAPGLVAPETEQDAAAPRMRLSPFTWEREEQVAYLSLPRAAGQQRQSTRRVSLKALLADRPADAPPIYLVDQKGAVATNAAASGGGLRVPGPGGQESAVGLAQLRGLAAVAPVAEGWSVAVLPASAELAARESSLRLRFILGGLAALAIGLALVHLVARRLRSAMDDVMSDFGDEEGSVPETVISELAQIGGALASARAKFGQTASELERARHDALTGLPGRELFLRQATAQVAAVRAMDDHAVAILYIDLDGFKAVNDRQGHRAGDEILRRVAATLRQNVRAPDTLGRLGGDEFVVCVSAPRRHLMEVATRAAEGISKGVAALGNGVGCSIGWATASCESNLLDLIEQADSAMYVNKLARRHESRTAPMRSH